MIKASLRGSVPERTPEQIAIIALQSLLEAREAHIEELEATARASKVANERKIAGLEESCHLKISAVRQAQSDQLASVRAELSSKAEEASLSLAALSEEFGKARDELVKTRISAEDLRMQLDNLTSQHEDLLQEHKALAESRDSAEQRRRIVEDQMQALVRNSTRAVREMESHLQALGETVKLQQQEINSLQMTVKMQCMERVLLQERLALHLQGNARS